MAGARGNIFSRPPGSGPEPGPAPSRSSDFFSPSAAAQTVIPPSFLNAIAVIQAQAQAYLNTAIACERARRWFQAIEYYRKLLSFLNKKRFPPEYIPGPGYIQLVFESYYHIGVAFQKVNNHRDAAEEFTYAIEAMNIPKIACKVGCVSSAFYQTPVYARRAYAYVKCAKIKEAINDATRAVFSDPANSDVYCIRALVWSSANEKSRALHDLNCSFRLNPSHVCTLILRGAILKSIGGVASSEHNKDQEKAFQLCPESPNFFDVEDFHSPKMPLFYDKFLWSLNAFHTVTGINLFAGAGFVPNLGPKEQGPMKPFKHGYSEYSDNTALLRRQAYTKACIEAGTIINGSRQGSVSGKKSFVSSATRDSGKKTSSSSVVRESVRKGSSASVVREFVKNGSSSTTVRESGSEDLKNYDISVAKKKKGGSSSVNWNV
ncbi:uncharacterized protein LOC103278911 isoform X2 [Anolis carolinensis]|uniref:uncharacterized protein LOC103278911 isoform X2 n=1 Tax=Anolis carolinensis TaxID=28377 RepID=UPI0004628BBD|nr:PREDICTED: uncharacterized protein LOC103278911 isoform X2 [Anolis carolinensis]|eukprot:XP_008109356.1 PREDICTED: uncharacterized protein LOC103278911 isoform X2 [Anolis carolinensis]